MKFGRYCPGVLRVHRSQRAGVIGIGRIAKTLLVNLRQPERCRLQRADGRACRYGSSPQGFVGEVGAKHGLIKNPGSDPNTKRPGKKVCDSV